MLNIGLLYQIVRFKIIVEYQLNIVYEYHITVIQANSVNIFPILKSNGGVENPLEWSYANL